MSNKLLNNLYFLSIFAGVSVFLAFERYNLIPSLILFPILFNSLLFRVSSSKQAFWLGFLTSFVVMVGGFYWVAYVLHEFAYVPWSVAVLMFLAFCGFGALNFPLFTLLGYKIITECRLNSKSKITSQFFIPFFLPALFTLIEYTIPKLFPWYLGHSLYQQPYLIQIVELTGCTFLTFLLYQTGSILHVKVSAGKFPKVASIVCASLWCFSLGFSWYRLNHFSPEMRDINVLLVQPNIGSLEKVAAEKGIAGRVTYVVEKYQKLTDEALAKTKSDLVLWPETAMPFQMDFPSRYALDIKKYIAEKNTNFIIGGYGKGALDSLKDRNAAFVFEPGKPNYTTLYAKSILLPFGEFLPLGDSFPALYRMFPQVANFERGMTQEPIPLPNGLRVGCTICYEDIIPSFYRRTAGYGPNVIVNLTNDSWFGPTSEPYLHASLTNFRAIEARIPFLRVTNTGTSFLVDIYGNILHRTGVFEDGVIQANISVPVSPERTIYVQYGDWIMILLGLVVGLGIWRLKNASVSV